MEYGTLTKVEQLEFNNIVNQNMSIETLIQRLILEQKNFEEDKNKWFNKIREKYAIPDEDVVVIDQGYHIRQVEQEKI